MHYPDAATARSDLPTRRAIAADGRSWQTGRPYRDGLVTLENATARGGDLTLELRPAGERPQIIFTMVEGRDLLFAACPSRP